MTRSALVMAGAAELALRPLLLGDGEPRDGLVTALEVTGMDLWGTELVVLSACNTGLGDTSRVGQGVYGLRRAFLIAGAETLITSLWSVEDRSTKELMVAYYEHLLAGKGRSHALHLAARQIRKRRPHPYHWAPFIVIGRGQPLGRVHGQIDDAAKTGRRSVATCRGGRWASHRLSNARRKSSQGQTTHW